MKRAKDKYMINRTKYKDIKRYDHKQMEDFLTDVYKNGYADGKESVPGVELQDVEKHCRMSRASDRSCGIESRSAWRNFSERRAHESIDNMAAMGAALGKGNKKHRDQKLGNKV